MPLIFILYRKTIKVCVGTRKKTCIRYAKENDTEKRERKLEGEI